MNQEVGELNKVVDKLQDTIDNLDEHAAIATYLVDGEVWRIQIVQKNKEFELPVVEETETQVYNGWKVNGTGDAVQTTSISEHTEFELDMIDKDWVKVNWYGLNNFDAQNIWTDGTDYYYSKGNMHFKKDPVNNAWEQVTWKGLTEFDGQYVWNYNGETYYSKGSKQYKLDMATKNWSTKNWVGLPNLDYFDGSRIWTDGTNYYLSHMAYDKVTYKVINDSTLEAVAGWNIDLMGDFIWTDGTYYFHSYQISTSNVLDPLTKQWSSGFVFTGSVIDHGQGGIHFDGRYVWTDGINTYYSSNLGNAIVSTATQELITIEFTGAPEIIYGDKIWTDGENIYYSNGTEQYVFVK